MTTIELTWTDKHSSGNKRSLAHMTYNEVVDLLRRLRCVANLTVDGVSIGGIDDIYSGLDRRIRWNWRYDPEALRTALEKSLLERTTP
jgi:hypothetical protein